MKLIMMNHNHISGKNIQLYYIDSDSFFSSINFDKINKDLKNIKNIFDFSNLEIIIYLVIKIKSDW